MKKVFLLAPVILLACATKTTSVLRPEVPVNEDFYPYHVTEVANIATNIYQLQLASELNEEALPLINDIQGKLVGKSFLSSQIFPEGSLFRKRVHHFSLDESSSNKHFIEAKLLKDEKYSSYKLVIAKIDPKHKKEITRQWLFPDTLNKEQLVIRIAKTIVRYSFQEL